MTKTVEAIYTNGHLEPVEPLDLRENERVTVTVQTQQRLDPEERKAALRHFRESVEAGSFYLTGKLPTRDELHER